MTNKKVFDVINSYLYNNIEKAVNDGKPLPWQKPWKSVVANDGPQNAVTNHHYNGINLMQTLVHTNVNDYRLPFYFTKKQFLNGNNRVKKEEFKNGVPILYFNTRKYKKKNDDGTTEEKQYGFFKYYMVWNYDQLEKPIEKIEQIIENSNDVDKSKQIKDCENIINGYKNAPKIEERLSNVACYIPSKDKVIVPSRTQYDKIEEFYSTSFHELVHSTGHSTRLNRNIGTSFTSHAYSEEELVAEIGSALLCGIAKIDKHVIDNSVAYTRGWLAKLKDNMKILSTSIKNAENAVEFILKG